MRIYYSLAEFESLHPVATVGMFDGVHRGHMGIIERLVAAAKSTNCESLVITFNPHPRIVLGNASDVRLLHSLDEKLDRFREAGVDVVLVVPFDASFANTDPSDFIKSILVDTVHVSRVITGHDHLFGQGRQGDFSLLEDLGKKHDFAVEQVLAIEECSCMVSSSAIRNAISGGDLNLANCMLGYPYSLKGKVVRGNQIGKLIGFPTANIQLVDPYKLIPSNGVYVSRVKWNGNIYNGMSNIGVRPTIDANRLTIEVNIFDFDEEIYTDTITIYFIHRIRDEKKFGGLEQLKEQLFQDREEVKAYLRN